MPVKTRPPRYPHRGWTEEFPLRLGGDRRSPNVPRAGPSTAALCHAPGIVTHAAFDGCLDRVGNDGARSLPFEAGASLGQERLDRTGVVAGESQA